MIRNKLSIFIIVFLLLFSAVLTLLFYNSYKQSYTERYVDSLTRQASLISEALSNSESMNMSRGNGVGRGQGKGMSMFYGILSVLDRTLEADFYLVSQEAFVSSRHLYSFDELDKEGQLLAEQAFLGKSAYQIYESKMLSQNTIAVAVPVFEENNISYALLFNRNVDSVDKELESVYRTFLLALGIALVLGLVAIRIIAGKIVRPVQDMEKITEEIRKGNLGVSTKVNSKDEIGNLAKNINIMSKKLLEDREAQLDEEQRRRNFIADIAHELKTPVAVMRGTTEAVKDGVLSNMPEAFDIMAGQISHLDKLVTDLLSLSKLQNMNFEIKKEKLSLYQLVSDAIRSQRILANKKQVEIEFKAEDIQASLIGDYSLLSRLISILINNAINYTADKHVHIHLKKDNLNIKNKADNIAQKEIDDLFKRFHKGNTGANGLGLAIAKEIAQRHDFKLSADMNDKQEIIFTLSFS
ncbi:MAG: HAMP domain-containing sensor histidine kinase [Eubacteriales bacterium]|nr:HAMP domain-containing sensor histidine kinase [Eubacteriales bacterium]